MNADRLDSQMVAGAADWLRIARARATDNAGKRRALKANEEVTEIKRRVGTETKETEAVHDRLVFGVRVLMEGCENS